VRPGFTQPARRARIADEVKQPSLNPEAITAVKAEPRCLSGKAVRGHSGLLVVSAYGVRHDMADCLGILVIVDQVGSDPRGRVIGRPLRGTHSPAGSER
jgi:hypothetical protein